MEIDNLSLDELKKIDSTTLPEGERKLLKKRKKFLKKQIRRGEKNKIIMVAEKKGKRKKLITYFIILLVSVIIGYFLYSTVTSLTGNAVEDFELTGETKEITMVAKKWNFVPNTVTVNQGDKVILNINSVDVAHGIALPQFNIEETLVPGKSVKLEFIADKKGKFQFICSIYCGSGHGSMRGKIVVK